MIHDKDGAKQPLRFTSCGTCLLEFPAATAQASADLCRAHVEAGCPKARPEPCEHGLREEHQQSDADGEWLCPGIPRDPPWPDLLPTDGPDEQADEQSGLW